MDALTPDFTEAEIAEALADTSEQVSAPSAEDLEPDEDAPYGYMIDPYTRTRRPKKKPGRQAKASRVPGRPLWPRSTDPVEADEVGSVRVGIGPAPSLEELKAARDDNGNTPAEDRAPETRRPTGKRGRGGTAEREKKASAPVPAFRAGPIAAGMNKLYLRVGKVVRAMDHDIGTAIMATTRKDGEDDVTVGEAWEEIAKTNPRIRAFLLKAISGGAWSSLFMAHAPIFLAILMKEGVRKHIPFGKLLGSVLDDDEDGPSEASSALGGLQGADVEQMMAMAQGMFAQMGAEMPRAAANGHVPRGTGSG